MFTSRHDDSLQRPAVADTPGTAAPESGSRGAVQVPTWHLHVTTRLTQCRFVHINPGSKGRTLTGIAACVTCQPIMFHRNVCWRTGQGGAGILYIEEQDQIVRKKRTFQYNASNK